MFLGLSLLPGWLGIKTPYRSLPGNTAAWQRAETVVLLMCIAFERIQIAAWFMIGVHLLWNVHEDKYEYLASNELVKKARMRECLLILGQGYQQHSKCLSPHGLILFKGQGGFFGTSQNLQ